MDPLNASRELRIRIFCIVAGRDSHNLSERNVMCREAGNTQFTM